jgi:hypothetical protein
MPKTQRILGRSDREALETMRRMAALIQAAPLNGLVLGTARRLVEQIDGRAQVAQARAIRAFVAGRLRFLRDPRGVEVLTPPAVHLAMIRDRGFVQGDCDDAATLAGALCHSIGLPVILKAVAFYAPNAAFSHVYAIARTYDKGKPAPVELDTTKGGLVNVPSVSRALVLEV